MAPLSKEARERLIIALTSRSVGTEVSDAINASTSILPVDAPSAGNVLTFDGTDYIWAPGGGAGSGIAQDGSNSPTADINWGGFGLINVQDIKDASLEISLSPNARVLYTVSGQDSVDWESKQLFFGNMGNTPAMDWGVGSLYDEAQVLSVFWTDRTAYDDTGTVSVNWGTREVNFPSGNSAISWFTEGTVDILNEAVLNLSGNLNFPITTSSDIGVLNQNNVSLLHTYGTSNLFLGSNAGNFTMTGPAVQNIGIGFESLKNNTSGPANTAIGAYCLTNNTSGAQNTIVGSEAGRFNTTGTQNSAFGNEALKANTTGFFNTAIGNESLKQNTTGQYNTALGTYALQINSIGSFNTACGFDALHNVTGNNNIGLGFEAGNGITSGTDNIVIGISADTSSPTASNELVIGNHIFSNAVDMNINRNLHIAGHIGVGNSVVATIAGTITKKIEVFDAAGVSIGFLPVYDSIT